MIKEKASKTINYLKTKAEDTRTSKTFKRDEYLKKVNEECIKKGYDVIVLPIQSKKFAKMEETVSYQIIKKAIVSHSKVRRFKNPYQHKLLEILRVITTLLTEDEMKSLFLYPTDFAAMVQVNKIKKIIDEKV